MLTKIYITWAILKTNVCIKPSRGRLEAIQKLGPPTTVKGCRCFAGIANFLNIICPDLQELLKPIHDLTRKVRQFTQGESSR